MRTRFPDLRTLPSRTVVTFKLAPTVRRSTCLPLKEKAEVRATTRRFSICVKALMISSVMPSVKNSLSESELIFENGSTTMAGRRTPALASVKARWSLRPAKHPRRQANRGQKAESALGNGLNEAGSVGVVAQGVAQLSNRDIQAVVEFDECVFGPQLAAQFFAGDNFAWALKEQNQKSERLLLKFDADALAQ